MKLVYVAFLIQACAGLSLLLLAVAVWLRKGTDLRLRPFLLMTAAAAAWVLLDALRLFSAFEGGPTGSLSATAGMFVVFTGWAVFRFAIRFPNEQPTQRWVALERALLLLGAGVALLAWRSDWVFNRRVEHGIPVASIGWPYMVTSGFTLLLTAIALTILRRRSRRLSSPLERAQLNYVFVGILAFTFFAYLFSLLLPVLGLRHLFFLGPTSALLFFGAVFFAIVQRKLFDVRRFAPYFTAGLVTLLVTGTLAYGGAAHLLLARKPHPLEIALGVTFLLLLGAVLFAGSFRFVRSGLFRRDYRIDELLNRVTETAAVFAMAGFDAMCVRLAVVFCRVIGLKRAALCVPDGRTFRFISVRSMPPGFPEAMIRFSRVLERVTPMLNDPRWPSFYWVDDSSPTDRLLDARGSRRVKVLTHAFRDELRRQDFDVFLPIRYGGRFLAFFFLGRKENGEPWFARELDRIGAVTGLIAVVLRNTEIFADLFTLKESLRIRNEALIDSSAALTRQIVSLEGDRHLIYIDPAMVRCVAELERVATTEESVLLLGESGTGKELAARLIHERSTRAQGPFVAINCGALTESLLESQLFGHEKGAFTGAHKRHRGVFEQAEKGTIFLDEVGEMPHTLQVRLLRALQERMILPVGSERALRIDARVVAATNRNLTDLVAAGGLRADLYYRLNVASVRLPPLRERPADIPLLVMHYLEQFAVRLGRSSVSLSEDAMRMLAGHHWPGNVRELENTLIRALLMSDDGSVLAKHFHGLPGIRPASQSSPAGEQTDPPPADQPEGDLLRRAEEAAILHALKLTQGNRTRAAKILGMSRSTLYERMKKHSLSA